MANIFAKISGRSVRSVPLPEWLFLKAGLMLGQDFGFDAFSIIQAMFNNRQMQLNRFDIPTTDVVKRLTGREAEGFETITWHHFNKSPCQIRSFSTGRSHTIREKHSWGCYR